jgi:hypothetical protein
MTPERRIELRYWSAKLIGMRDMGVYYYVGPDSENINKDDWIPDKDAKQCLMLVKRLAELETDLIQYAVLRVRKDSMPPGASLAVCYDDGSGVPVIDDEGYSDYAMVRRDDLSFLFL